MARSTRTRPPRPVTAKLSQQAEARARSAHSPDSSPLAAHLLDGLLKLLPIAIRSKTRDYLLLTRMDRPIGALLLLWPTWWALWLAANDFPPLGPLVIFTLGVFIMRAAGCIMNDYADRKLDPQVSRTAHRPLATGRLKPHEAMVLFAVLLFVAFILVLFTNRLTIELSFAGAALAIFYPFSKRYTQLPQVVLGAAFGWSIPMAFAAVQGHVPPLAWLLFLANILWSTIYDTQYAMVDREDDLKAGVKSSAILFGDADLVILGILMATFLLAMLFIGFRADLGWPYWLALMAALGLFIYQQWLIRHREPGACLKAFRHNHWLGLTVWVGIALSLALS